MKKKRPEEDFEKAEEKFEETSPKTQEVNKLSERAQKTTGQENTDTVKAARKVADSPKD